MKIAVWQIPTVRRMVQCFSTEILQQVTSLPCCVWPGTLIAHESEDRDFFTFDGFSPAFQSSAVSVAVQVTVGSGDSSTPIGRNKEPKVYAF